MKRLNEDLKTGQLKQVYLLFGEEGYLKRQYRDRLTRALLPEGNTMNYACYEGKGTEIREVIDLAETMPFFAERRLIVFENTGFFKSGGNDLADYIGINRSYLTNSFRKIMNMSPQKFLITLRLDKAISLLRETALPIHTISAQVGYDDPLAFSKMFKQNYGISPTSFREAPEKLIKYENKNEYMRSLSI